MKISAPSPQISHCVWEKESEVHIVEFATHTRERIRHRLSNGRSWMTSSLTSSTVLTRSRDIAIGRLFRRKPLGRLESPLRVRLGLGIFGEYERELCSAHVGRNDGYNEEWPRDLFSATSPPSLHFDSSATTPARTVIIGLTEHW